jgi:RNA-directed DNA polymerase
LGYGCAMSLQAQSRIMAEWKRHGWYRRTVLTIQELSQWINEQMHGIIHYYGRFGKWALSRLFWHLDFRIAKWVSKKYKKLKRSQKKAYLYLQKIKSSYPNMFYHWTIFN